MNIPEFYKFFSQPKINSGINALENIPVELGLMNAKKPLFVTDKKAARTGVCSTVVNAFKDSNVTIGGIFDETLSYTDLKQINRISGLYRLRSCDSIIAIGGGSVINTAKGLNIAVTEKTEDILIYTDIELKKRLKPFIAIPTASVTGYDITNITFIDGQTISSPLLFPDIVIIDPRLMRVTDDSLINSSLVAFVHSIEALVDPCCNPVLESYAYAAVQLISENLARIVQNPNDKNGCHAIVNAISLSGIVHSNTSTGLASALGRALSNTTNISEAICMGILLPYALEIQLLKGNTNMDKLLLAIGGFDVYCITPVKKRGKKVIDSILKLHGPGSLLPDSLKLLKIPEYKLKDVAQAAAENSTKFSYNDCIQILEHAFEGNPIKKL